MIRRLWPAVAIASLAAVPLMGEPAPVPVAAAGPAAAVGQPQPDPAADTVTVPALTPLVVSVDNAISSKTAKRGDRFGITLSSPLIFDGLIIAPAGTRGEGEVVHAAGVGFGGRAGELIVAARFLTIGDQRLPLQSFRLSKSGKSNTGEAIGIMAAGGAIGAVAALFITGTSAEIAAGQIALAKTSQSFVMPKARLTRAETGGETAK